MIVQCVVDDCLAIDGTPSLWVDDLLLGRRMTAERSADLAQDSFTGRIRRRDPTIAVEELLDVTMVGDEHGQRVRGELPPRTV
jgi:hypothetical protein